MSIDSIKMGQPSFAGKTKDGNDYDKTCAGKVAGGMIGVHVAAGKIRQIQRTGDAVYIRKATAKFAEKQAKMNPKSTIDIKIAGQKFAENFKKNLKASKAIGSVIAAGVTFGLWIGIGAIVDKMINSHRAHKADKEAE